MLLVSGLDHKERFMGIHSRGQNNIERTKIMPGTIMPGQDIVASREQK